MGYFFKMKKLILILLTLTLFSFSATEASSWSAEFQVGLDAYESRDYTTAVRVWKRLSENGEADAHMAEFWLGNMYYQGKGVPQDFKTAMKWFRQSAEQGSPFAQQSLGDMYRKGEGVQLNYKTAVKWYRLAAGKGYTPAHRNLGVAYGLGHGVQRNLSRAHMWLNIAASSGDKSARKQRKAVAKRMTSSQIEKAQDLASECVRKNYKEC